MGGLLALYTAALAPEVRSALVEHSLVSYRSLVATPNYDFHVNTFVPGVLGAYDLDDVAGLAAPRPVTFLNAVDQNRLRVTAEFARSQYRNAAAIYRLLGNAGALEFLTADGEDQVLRSYKAWVEGIPK
jgi:hypothetical protein